MKSIIYVLLVISFVSGCSKMQEKKTTQESSPPLQQPHNTTNSQTENKSSGQTDEKAIELSKNADESIAAYSTDKSERMKKEVIEKCMAAGNYLEFEADLPAREKYRPALGYYRKVLELDPKNGEAIKNKKEIEDIYTQMGMPIPK